MVKYGEISSRSKQLDLVRFSVDRKRFRRRITREFGV